MHIVLIAADVGPSNYLELVAAELTARHTVTAFLGKGQPFPKNSSKKIKQTVQEADRVLIGLSSTKERSSEELVAARTARNAQVAYGFICDTYGAFRRPWFADYIQKASFLFVLNEAEIPEARTCAPRAKIIASGNPEWGKYFSPVFQREEMRARLNFRKDDRVVLVVGTKEAVRNMFLFGSVIMAARNLDETVRIVISRHPGERNPEELYHDMLQWSERPVVFLKEMNSNEVITGADVVVSSFSSISIAAACQRVPVIDFATALDEKWWEDLSGSKSWPPALSGATKMVSDVFSLTSAMKALLDPASSLATELQVAQTKAFPSKNTRGALKKIVSCLTE